MKTPNIAGGPAARVTSFGLPRVEAVIVVLPHDAAVSEFQKNRKLSAQLLPGHKRTGCDTDRARPDDFHRDAIAAGEGTDDLEVLRTQQSLTARPRVFHGLKISRCPVWQEAIWEFLLDEVRSKEPVQIVRAGPRRQGRDVFICDRKILLGSQFRLLFRRQSCTRGCAVEEDQKPR
jgi:hypothetical protein